MGYLKHSMTALARLCSPAGGMRSVFGSIPGTQEKKNKNFKKFTINLDFSIDNYDKLCYNVIVNNKHKQNNIIKGV